jgi:uncharacterized protein with FMN-binding domain
MEKKPKIMVLKLRELIYTGIFLALGIILVILCILMFRPKKENTPKRTPISNSKYTAGVYTSSVTLGDAVLDVEVTVDSDHINSIRLRHLSETTAAMYPLVQPALEELSEQIVETQSTENLTWEGSGKYTAQIILGAIEKALQAAENPAFSN